MSVIATQNSCQASFKGVQDVLLMVMYVGTPGRKQLPWVALFKNVSDVGSRCWVVWGGLFFSKRDYGQDRIGFLYWQHLGITDNLEKAMGSDPVEILKVAIMYIVHRQK